MNLKIKQKIKYFFSLFFMGVYLLLSFPVFAATISVRPLVAQVNAGANFTVSIDINTQGKTINNAEAIITFPKDLVEVVALNTSKSIFSIWVEQPAFSNSDGVITFNGGVPNPGFTGSGGQILSVQFKSKNSGTAQFAFASAAIRENDGLGTNILSGQSGASLSIVEQKSEEPALPEAPNIQPDQSGQVIVLNSPTHQDSTKWYNQKSATFSWKLPSGASISQTSLDKSQGVIPRVQRKPAVSSISVPEVQDGVWYFNARFLTPRGWSKVSSYKIQVDTVPPESVSINSTPAGAKYITPTVIASDSQSGIDYLLVQIDSAQAVKIIPTGNETEISLPGVVGVHMVNVTAFDKAGNSSVVSANVEFKESRNVRILNYSQVVEEGERITINGVGPQSSPIEIKITTQDGVIRTYTTTSTVAGYFSLQTEPIAGVGVYDILAQHLLPNGVLDTVSSHVKITVSPSTVTKFSTVVKSWSRFVTASNIIIIILSILCVLGWLNYFLLKKSLNLAVEKKKSSKKSQ